MAKRFITPFAEAGDRSEISDTPIGTDVNFQTGYTAEYEADPVTDPNAKYVERDKTNQLFNDITGNIKLWQENTYPEFITEANNGGVAFPYKEGAIVSFNGDDYISLIDNNTTLPTSSDWIVYIPEKSQQALKLKIFQSPTDNLTKVETFAGGAGVVYEVRKTSDNSLATIYSDKDGVTSIPQNGTANVSNGDAALVFYILDGDYYIEIDSVQNSFKTSESKAESIAAAIAHGSLGGKVKINDLAHKSFSTYRPAPEFIKQDSLDLLKAGESDGMTYFYDYLGNLYERRIDIDPRGNSVMAYTEHWSLDLKSILYDAHDAGIKGFYIYLSNGVYNQTDAEVKALVDILLKYNFSLVLGMSAPQTGYESIIDFWAETFDHQNVVGIGFIDEPEFFPTQTIAWQQDVIAYIRTYSQKPIYTASVGTLGSAGDKVAPEIDFVLWDYYRQNTSASDVNVYAYDLAQLESLGKRKGRAIPVIGLYGPGIYTATKSQIEKWNNAILSMRPDNIDVWAFVFYTRPGIHDVNLYSSSELRGILGASTQYKNSLISGASEYASFGVSGYPQVGVSALTTASMNATKEKWSISDSTEIRFQLNDAQELCRYALTLQDISGGSQSKETFFNIQAFVDGEWVDVKIVSHTPISDGNPAFKSTSIGSAGWTAPTGVKSKDWRIISPNAYSTGLNLIYNSALIFGHPKT